MVSGCLNWQLLAGIIDNTVSCSHWKRSNQQCGVCVPCIIRRSALYAGGMQEQTEYSYNKLAGVLGEPIKRDDLLALSIAVLQKSSKKIGPWISDNGPLPQSQFQDFKKVFSRGLDEVEIYLKAEGIL